MKRWIRNFKNKRMVSAMLRDMKRDFLLDPTHVDHSLSNSITSYKRYLDEQSKMLILTSNPELFNNIDDDPFKNLSPIPRHDVKDFSHPNPKMADSPYYKYTNRSRVFFNHLFPN